MRQRKSSRKPDTDATMTRKDEDEIPALRIHPDLTWKRVTSPAVCPLCRHDNRLRQEHCPHLISRIEHQDKLARPKPGGDHIVAQGYANPSDPDLAHRFFVYRGER